MTIYVYQKDIFAEDCFGGSRLKLYHVDARLSQKLQGTHDLSGFVLTVKTETEAGLVIARWRMIGRSQHHKARYVVRAILDVGPQNRGTGQLGRT